MLRVLDTLANIDLPSLICLRLIIYIKAVFIRIKFGLIHNFYSLVGYGADILYAHSGAGFCRIC
jgi:hypothetical protein